MYFCFEKDFANRWNPVLYASKPHKRIGWDLERSSPIKVPPEMEGYSLADITAMIGPPSGTGDAS